MVSIRGVWHVAARVPDTCVHDARQLANQVLHAPEATAREHRTFKPVCHDQSSPSTHGGGRRRERPVGTVARTGCRRSEGASHALDYTAGAGAGPLDDGMRSTTISIRPARTTARHEYCEGDRATGYLCSWR